MRLLALSLLLFLATPFLHAQANIAGLLYASNFAAWTVPQGNQGQMSWSSPSFCTVTSGGATFRAFTVGVPITLVDSETPSNTEVVTPTQANYSGFGCSISAHTVNPHNSFYFRTATAGLGEALAFAGTATYQVLLTPDWTRLGGLTSTITSATGNTSVTILDQRSAVIVPYVWGGSAYASQPFSGGAVSSVFTRTGSVVAQTGDYTVSQVTGAAPLASPTFTGVPAVPTATVGTNTTQAASTAFVLANASGGGFPITLGSTSIASGSTTTALAGFTAFQNVRYLSCASELGAQITAAITALGATGGRIVMPNCTTATQTTGVTQIPNSISIVGYGVAASKVTCSVAGDCLDFHMNPNTQGEVGSEITGFTMIGSNVASQVLIHGEGMSGYHIHHVGLDGPASGTKPVCMEFENTTTDLTFTERNIVEMSFGANCAPAVLFNQDAGDSNISYGYNDFHFSFATQGSNFGVVFNGGGILYGGTMQVWCNHIGPGGGCLQFNNNFAVSGPNNAITEHLFVSAEENGSGAGVVLAATGTSQLNFDGHLYNGSSSASGLATLTSIAGGASLIMPTLNAINPFGSSFGTLGLTGGTTALQFDPAGNAYVPSGRLQITGATGNGYELNLVGPAADGGTGIQIDATAQTSGKKMQLNVSGTNFYLYDSTDNTNIVSGGGNGSFTNVWKVGALGTFGWDSSSQFASSGLDTGISRTAADTVAIGNGTQADVSGALVLQRIVLRGGTSPTITGCGTISSQSGGSTAGSFVTSTTGTCTAAFALPTVTHGYTCYAQDVTQHVAANALFQSATSTTGCTVTGTTVASDVITFTAIGW